MLLLLLRQGRRFFDQVQEFLCEVIELGLESWAVRLAVVLFLADHFIEFVCFKGFQHESRRAFQSPVRRNLFVLDVWLLDHFLRSEAVHSWLGIVPDLGVSDPGRDQLSLVRLGSVCLHLAHLVLNLI
jgi:hypothetical protein